MKLTIEINLKDGKDPINEACESVNFSKNWGKLTPEHASYLICLLHDDLEFADEIFHEKESAR